MNRLLVLAPDGRDAAVVVSLLTEADIPAEIDATGEALLRAIRSGDAAGAVVTEKAITRIGMRALRDALAEEPTWSDFPFVVLTRRGEDTRDEMRAIEQVINATLLERPLHPASLVSAARAAFRSRERQRVAAGHLAELEAARADLRSFADTLEAKVRDRTRDLATANDRLTKEIADRERAEARLVQAQKMEAVGQLTGGIAHDFNNLLTAVIGSLDLLLRRLEDERSMRLATNALHAAERGARVTAQLLAFSRRQRLSPAAVEINETIEEMRDLLARSLGPRIDLTTELDPDLGAALVDPTQVEMMILNLAINARDAMPEGGKLSIATRLIDDIPASLQAELQPGRYVCISVTDSGTGMSPSVVERAFEPFFTTKEPGKGTGLGLSQLYGFAKQSGGTARIESVEGKGTVVSIYLPCTERSGKDRAKPALAHPDEQNGRILLVDDDDDVRAAATAILQELGYEVTSAEHASRALELLDGSQFDLVLTDVVMPGMGGVELARRIAARTPDLPILFATGYADLDDFADSLDNTMIVRKPFRMAELAARIAAARSAPERVGR